VQQDARIGYYKESIHLPVVFYGRETWFLILSKEYGQKVFENTVLRRTSGPKGHETTGGWRKLHNQELHLFSSQNIITIIVSKRKRWARHAA
jgi:hypothetical protein